MTLFPLNREGSIDEFGDNGVEGDENTFCWERTAEQNWIESENVIEKCCWFAFLE